MRIGANYLFALECVAVPVLWGLLMVAILNAIERAAGRRQPHTDSAAPLDNASSSPEYHI